MTAGAEDLERRCRDLLGGPASADVEGAPIAFVDREMALTLDHIDRLRRRDRRVRRQLLERECDIDARIMNLRPLPYQNLGPEWIDRTKLINQLTNVLAKISEHYRRNAAEYDTRMNSLHDRLLQLLNMREQLNQHDGHSPDTP